MRALTLATFLLLGAAVPAFASRQIIGSEQDHSLAGDAGDCESFYSMTFSSFRSQIHDREQREISLSGVEELRVIASQEGGVSIRGWKRPYARMVVCRYAVAHTKEQATRLLASIDVSSANGRVVAAGPAFNENQAWWANITVYVPHRSAVDVTAENGGIAIRNMAGRVSARTTRGGISVARSSGQYNITTGSGGITLERITGNVAATSQNGAIALKLEDRETATIEARGQSEIHCSLRDCGDGKGVWGTDRKALRIGAGTPDIRLTTGHAPITIMPVAF